jgi:uroporphyrinogen-III synthase
VDPLTGWTIAITAERRADEQAALLQRRGADVVLAPLVRARQVPEPALRNATSELLSQPLDVLVATTGVGIRSWLAWSWTWGVGDELADHLRSAAVWARGGKAVGALVSEGIDAAWRAPTDRLSELVDELLRQGVDGRRVGVQLHGGDTSWCTEALAAAGASVVPVPVYELVPAADGAVAERLARSARRGELDAVTCTSPAAVAALAAIPGLVDDLRRTSTVCACVGPVTGAAAEAAGLGEVVVAIPARLGSMVRCLGERLGTRGRTVRAAEVALRHQGGRVEVDGHEIRLTPRERRLLEAVLAGHGAVVSKDRLAEAAWDAPVEGHAVEVAVNRLRRKLGPAAVALETSTRRGYRIAI